MDPAGLLSVDVRNLLRRDAVQHGDLFRQVQQRQLLQVQSLVDCGEDGEETPRTLLKSRCTKRFVYPGGHRRRTGSGRRGLGMFSSQVM